TSFPEGALDSLKTSEGTLNLFHNYETGGYISYYSTESGNPTSPRNLVFIDGRFLHFPPQIFEWYKRISGDPTLWDSFAESFKIDCVVLVHSLPRLQNLLSYLIKSQSWQLTYMDSVCCVFSPELSIKEFVDAPIQFMERLKIDGYKFSDKSYPGYHAVCAARMLLLFERYNFAKELIEKSAELHNEFPELIYYLACAYEGTGDLQTACSKLKETAELLPENAEIWQSLGNIAYRLDDIDTAQKAFRHLLELDKNNTAALEFFQKSNK
ncbi:MAG: tetratricopeptide repeat protein, partial [Planctomycetota bacterium]